MIQSYVVDAVAVQCEGYGNILSHRRTSNADIARRYYISHPQTVPIGITDDRGDVLTVGRDGRMGDLTGSSKSRDLHFAKGYSGHSSRARLTMNDEPIETK